MDINIINQVGQCTEFYSSKGVRETVSIIVSPLKVTAESDTNIRVTNGCNLWQGCFNKNCHFSSAARKLPKVGQNPGPKG